MTFQIESPPITIDQFCAQSWNDEEYRRKLKPNGKPYSTVDASGYRGHCAYDANDTYGDRTLYACFDGRTWTKTDPFLGIITKLEASDGSGLWYCHQQRRLTSNGEKVEAWEPIGILGATGQATGTHCHLIGMHRVHDYGSIFNYGSQLRALKEVLMMLRKKDVETIREMTDALGGLNPPSDGTSLRYLVQMYRDMKRALDGLNPPSNFTFPGPVVTHVRSGNHP